MKILMAIILLFGVFCISIATTENVVHSFEFKDYSIYENSLKDDKQPPFSFMSLKETITQEENNKLEEIQKTND
ncbi:MAG: hypothetical protein WC915_06295 [archaeon]|jgi:hypothetical protein